MDEHDRAPLLRRMVIQTVVLLAVMGVILFATGGDWHWPQAWIFLAETGISSFLVSFWLLHHDPALLASRLSVPLQRDQEPVDRLIMIVLLGTFLAWFVLIGLDARHFHWSAVPVWGQVAGAVLIALCMIACWQVFRFNTFAAPQVRFQAGRAHHVISDGPYRIVRHPLYTSALLYFAGAPLLLGSGYGLLAALLLVAGLAIRIPVEERMLRQKLEGYEDYAKRVPYRLVPGLW